MHGSAMVFVVAAAIIGTAAVHPNGIDLVDRDGRPGDVISGRRAFLAHLLPNEHPVEHVRLYLIAGKQRIEFFDVPANDEGVISAEFRVPNLEAGRYPLEACGGLEPEGGPCLPEGLFTVHPGPFVTAEHPSARQAPSADGSGGSTGLLVAAAGGVVLLVVIGTVVVRRRRRAR